MNLPGENLGITLKINKWALLRETACNKMKSTTYPYHVVLAPKTNTKKRQRKWDKLPRRIKNVEFLTGTQNIYSER
jgi:hypothetical protein